MGNCFKLRRTCQINLDLKNGIEDCGFQVYNGLAMLLLSLHPRFSAHRFAGPAIIGGGLFSRVVFGAWF